MDAKVRRWAEGVLGRHRAALARICGESRMPPPPRGPAAAEGCGGRGCVFATGDARVVLKVTSDADEAGFAAASMAAKDPPRGVVRYFGAVRLAGEARAFALWREASPRPGLPDDHYRRSDPSGDLLWAAHQAACLARSQAGRSGDPRRALAAAAAAARSGRVSGDVRNSAAYDPRRAAREVAGIGDGAERCAAALWLFRRCAVELGGTMPLVGGAMAGWMDRGVLLCDVVADNVGVVLRSGREETVIIDPGMALLLDGSHDRIRLREVGGPERGAVAHAIGVEDDVQIDDRLIDEETVIFHGGAPTRYLRDARAVGLPKARNPGPSRMSDRDAFELFLRERQRFSAKYPAVSEASFELSDEPCNSSSAACRERDVAHCSWLQAGRRGRKRHQRVVLLRRALSLPVENLVAVIRHELGHLADPRAGEAGPGGEARADRIAEEVGGQHINYDAIDLQTIGPGRRRRPPHLHQ